MSVLTSGGGINPETIASFEKCYEGTISPNGRQIVYYGLEENSPIYLANINGSNQHILGNVPLLEDQSPSGIWGLEWSPDGKNISFHTNIREKVYVMSIEDNTKVKNVFMGPLYSDLLWSPDSKWIFYIAEVAHHGSLLTYPLAYRLSDSYANIIDFINACYPECIHFEWSRDSKSISYVPWINPKFNYECAPEECEEMLQQSLVNATITYQGDARQEYIPLPRQELPKDEMAAWDPKIGIRWAPDMSSFLIMQRFTRTLYVLNRDGTIKNVVLPFTESPLEIGWSPDGKWIYFLLPGSDLYECGTLGIIRPDGSDMRILAYDVSMNSIVWAQ
jgi:Tol biopolymer transport system component